MQHPGMVMPHQPAPGMVIPNHPMPGMMPHPNMALWPGGVPGTSGGSAMNSNSGTDAGQDQESEEEIDPFDEDWSNKALLGGTKSAALTKEQRAFLYYHALNGKISKGTLQNLPLEIFDAIGYLLWQMDPAGVNLKSLNRAVTPRKVLEELTATQSEVYSPEAVEAVIVKIAANIRNNDALVQMALEAGYTMDEAEDKQSKRSRMDHRGNAARGGYGCRSRPSEADAYARGISIQEEVSDNLQLQIMQQKLQLAELKRKAAEAELEAQQCKDTLKQSLGCSDRSSTRSPTESSEEQRIADADSSASPASVLSAPPGTSASAAAAALAEPTEKKALVKQLHLKQQQGERAAAKQAQTDRKARIAALAGKLLLEKRKNAEKAKAAKEEAERTARIAARAKELQKLKTAALAASPPADAMGFEMDCVIDAISEEEEASSAHQQAPAAMTDEAEAAELQEEAMSIVGNSPFSFHYEAED